MVNRAEPRNRPKKVSSIRSGKLDETLGLAGGLVDDLCRFADRAGTRLQRLAHPVTRNSLTCSGFLLGHHRGGSGFLLALHFSPTLALSVGDSLTGLGTQFPASLTLGK
jgi:hypothetical protein